MGNIHTEPFHSSGLGEGTFYVRPPVNQVSANKIIRSMFENVFPHLPVKCLKCVSIVNGKAVWVSRIAVYILTSSFAIQMA